MEPSRVRRSCERESTIVVAASGRLEFIEDASPDVGCDAIMFPLASVTCIDAIAAVSRVNPRVEHGP